MMEGFGEIMTLEETAKYLKIGKSTLYKMAREGKIPAVKIANEKNNKWCICQREEKNLYGNGNRNSEPR